MKQPYRIVAIILLFSIFLIHTAQAEMLTAKECAQLVWDTIKNDYPDLFEPVKVDYSETRLVAFVKTEGLENMLATAYQEGYGQHYPQWVEYKEMFLESYRVLQGKLQDNGRGNMFFELWLCNDQTLGSIFIRYLAAASNGESLGHDVMWRSDEKFVEVEASIHE